MKNKWEVKSHSYQIGDTGDYDGWHELTNGSISLGTNDDDEETVEVLNALAGHLNAWDIELFDQKADNLAIDMHYMEEGWKIKYDELKADYEQYVKDFNHLYAEHQRLADALKIIQNWQLPPTGQFWDKEQTQPMSFEAAYGSNGVRDFMCNVANEALSECQQ